MNLNVSTGIIFADTQNLVALRMSFDGVTSFILAHLSRRLIGELIVYRSSRRPSGLHTFKHEYLCSQLADWDEILSEASLGWGKGFGRF